MEYLKKEIRTFQNGKTVNDRSILMMIIMFRMQRRM